jgi:hypothetical protein
MSASSSNHVGEGDAHSTVTLPPLDGLSAYARPGSDVKAEKRGRFSRMTEDRKRLFDQRVEKCSPYVQEALAFLRSEAERLAGPQVQSKIEGQGIGITYVVGGANFCRFDPKFLDGHEQVWAKLSPSPDAVALKETGLHSRRQERDGPWILVNHIRDAKRLVPLIAQAYLLASTG